MNIRLLYIVAVAALGGFLFGFDSGVISGCEKAIQAEFGLSAFWHVLIISGALIGTVIGVFTAGRPSDRWGRKPTLWLMAILFLVSAVGCAVTPFDAVLCRLKYASFAFEYAIDFRGGGMVSFCAEANLWVVGGDNA